MDRMEWLSYLQHSSPLILDGATGTNLQAAGLPAGVCPETWVLDNPEVFQNLQRAFYAAGSDLVYVFSFGANRIKLGRHGIPAADVESVNTRLAALSCEVRDEVAALDRTRRPLVAGDLAPTGEFLKPAGNLEFDELIDIYREQVRGLLAAGVDLFVAETMLDLAQTRAAVLAVRTECDLPVMASLTVEKNGRTLSGNSIRECVIALAASGADAVGLNCSFGPEGLGQLVHDVLQISPVPLLVKPNAGIPKLVDGKTIFDMQPDSFAQAMGQLAMAGIRLIGGCCGTRPEHIAALATEIRRLGLWSNGQSVRDQVNAQVRIAEANFAHTLCSARQTLDWRTVETWPTVTVTDPDDLLDEILEAADDEPRLICVDTGSFNPDQIEDWLDALDSIQMTNPLPLVFQGEQPDVLRAIVHRYQGRTGILSDSVASIQGAIVRRPV